MMIAYPAADICCKMDEECIMTLVIENQHLFYSLVCDITNQMQGLSGSFVLSEDYQPLDMRKYAEVITQLVPFTVNQKELLNKLYTELKKYAVSEEMYHKTNELFSNISKYLYILTEDNGNELIYDVPEDINGILKAFNLRYDDSELSLTEKILEYSIAVNQLKGERVLILINLRSYLTDKQAEELFKNFILRKIRVICIENKEYKRLSPEKRIIVDEDMCVI